MKTTIRIFTSAFLLFTASCLAQEKKNESPDEGITIDIPVKMDQAKVVFTMNHTVMRGDMPVGLHYMELLSKNFKENGTKGEIIAVFYNDGGHFTLNDEAYNKARGVKTGNPYKGIIASLMTQGVRIEECGMTMRTNKWTNKDLLPGVKVNSGAVQRIIQLDQEGFVQIQP